MSVRKLAIAAASALTIISANAQAEPVIDKANGIISEEIVFPKSVNRAKSITKVFDCKTGVLSIMAESWGDSAPTISNTDIGSTNVTRSENFRQKCINAGISPGF